MRLLQYNQAPLGKAQADYFLHTDLSWGDGVILCFLWISFIVNVG